MTLTPRLTFDPLAHVYALDGVPFDFSVTGVLRAARYIDFDGIPTGVLERAQARGHRVHQAAHYLTEGTLDWTTVIDSDRGYVQSAARLLESGEVEVLAQEVLLYHPGLRYAGACDLLAWWRGGPAVLDYKTGNPDDVAADLQTAAYAEALRALIALGLGPVELLDATPSDHIARASVRLHADGRCGTLHRYDSPYDWSFFHAALVTVREVARRHPPRRQEAA